MKIIALKLNANVYKRYDIFKCSSILKIWVIYCTLSIRPSRGNFKLPGAYVTGPDHIHLLNKSVHGLG